MMEQGPQAVPGERALVGLGSNLGDRRAHLDEATHRLAGHADVDLIARSSIRQTEPVGGPPQGRYLNAVVELEVRLTPRELLDLLLSIEAELGRVRTVVDGPRTLDLDLLLFGDRVLDEPGLRVPHPRIAERAFVLEPLAEIAAERVHPETGQTCSELLDGLRRREVEGSER